jgi:hypothetical protein
MLELAEHTVVLAKLDLFDKAALEELAGETAADLRALLPSQLLSIAPALAIMYLKHCRDPTPAGFMFSLRSLADTFGKALTVDDVVSLFAVSTLDVLKQGVDISKPAAITMARMNYVIEAQAKKVAELEAAHALALAKRPNNRGNEFRRDGRDDMIYDRRRTRPRMDDHGSNPYGNTRDPGRYTDRYTDRREPSRANEAYDSRDTFQGCAFFQRKGWCQAEPCRGCAYDRRSHAARVAMIPAGTPPWRGASFNGSSSIPRAHAPRQPTAAPTPGAPAATPAARRRAAAAAP